ncbi:CLUMA_CG015107, isoform A [Clunio marinus]|uniref:CLUMA_CG015107, isoform A n=1 Tax=Clunio marinus TaxID=568069 RepID=A0A1J1IQG7_9DIPT|nr:CLUMA_CG015107, isoform A [Clunio marinus]
MSFQRFLIVQILLCMVKNSYESRILVILPIPFKEHQTVYQPLIENLHKHEHEITVLTTNPVFKSRDGIVFRNVTEIDLSFVYNLNILDELRDVDLEGSEMLKTIFNVMRKIYEVELKSPKVEELFKLRAGHFDLVIVDWSGSSSLMNIFAHHFKVPLVAITNGEAFPNVHEAFGNPSHPISFPSVFLPFTKNLNLLQRISSVLFTIWYRFYYFTEEIPLQNEIIKNVLNEENAPNMWEIASSADLLLINSYEILNNIRPIVPTTIYLGGIHQKAELKPLSKSLKKFLDESERVVYVSLSNGFHQDRHRFEKLLTTLEKFDVDIVWNINDDYINTTSRMYQSNKIDQEGILAHPKTILHVTDGGQRNIEDSIHHTVPVFGISYTLIYDHYLQQIEKFECGLISVIDFDNQNEVENKLEEIISSMRFKSNAVKLRNLIIDQPIGNSVERATWWINYVIRNGGTKHLLSEHKTLSWMKYLMLDVLFALLLGFASMLFSFAYIIERIRRYSKSLPYEKVTRGSKSKVL